MRSLPPLAVLTALALAGGAAAQSPTLMGTTWTLTKLTEAGNPVAPGSAAPRPALRLDGNTASGSTGCNTYRASYVARGGVLRFGPLATTRRACPDRLDGLEERFLNLMGRVTRFQLGGGALTLFAGSRDRLVFTAEQTSSPQQPEASVNLDGTWTLIGGTALRVVPGGVPSLTFAGDRVSGTGGCNRLTGSFQLEGKALTLGPLASTRMACSPEVNAQETAFLAFLGRPLTASRQAVTLTLTSADRQTLVFRRGGVQGGAGLIEGGVGVARSQTSGADGSYALAAVDGQPAPRTSRPITLTLEGGRIGGNDGCNSFGGGYRLEDGHLVLTGPLVSTRMACPNSAGEVNFPGVLRNRPTLTVTPEGLTLAAGGTRLEFNRVSATGKP
ncbi:META domain-containing protein [Deinococcus apachensis]|uniref:META domain-containing protein n=1 Tax=Deinococcus apachensis TaxID=309886 RepID=UPI00035C55AF|nr:META domain-containing protein [Deinococcus apachensis]